MEQGAVCYAAIDHIMGTNFELRFSVPRIHMVVSCTEFNEAPGIGYVWVLPVDSSGSLQVRQLHHAAHDKLMLTDDVPAPGESLVREAVQYVKWGINGREPQASDPEWHQELHRQAISTGSKFNQADIAVHRAVPYVIVSGLAFNTFPENDVVWGVPIARDSIMHAELILSLPKKRLRATKAKVDEEDTARLLGQLNRILSGIPPDWQPEDATREPSSPGRGADDHP